MNSLKHAMGLSLVVLLSGCTHNVALNPNITPTASVGRAVDLRVGLYVPDEVRGYVISDTEGSSLDKYVFPVGESLDQIIHRSAARVFTHVASLVADPTSEVLEERNLDLAIVPRILEARVTLGTSEGAFQDEAVGTTTISVELSVYDEEMIRLTTVVGNGVGNASERKGLFTDSIFGGAQKEYAVSVEDALRSLGNDMVRQMYSNYDIRKRAEANE